MYKNLLAAHRSRVSATTCAALLIGLLFTFECEAQWSNSALVNTPVCTAAGRQTEPVMVSDGAGGAIIAWVDERQLRVFGSKDIYAQRLNAAGVAQWQANGIPIASGIGNQYEPRLVEDGAGGAIIVYTSGGGPGQIGGVNIRAHRVDANGTKLWGAGGKSVCLALGEQSKPVAVADGNGGVYIAWEDRRNGGDVNETDIYAVRLDADGFLSGGWPVNGVVVSALEDAQNKPAIVRDGEGGAIVGWLSDLGPHPLPYLQRFDGSGNAQWAANGIHISSIEAYSEVIHFVNTTPNGCIAAWSDYAPSCGDPGGEAKIHLQRFGVESPEPTRHWGTPPDTGLCVLVGDNPIFRVSAATDDGDGGVIIFTQAFQQEFFRGQRVDNSGARLWGDAGASVIQNPSYALVSAPSHGADAVSDMSGGGVIVWTDVRVNEFTPDIYAQRMDSAGTRRWKLNGKAVSRAARGQYRPDIINAGSGYIVVWEDYRTGPTTAADIYAQRVKQDGSLGGHGDAPEGSPLLEDDEQENLHENSDETLPSKFALHQNYPNPFNPSTEIKFDLPEISNVSLVVYDVLGRKIAELENGMKEAGYHSSTWNASDVASGVYFARFAATDQYGNVKLRKVSKLLFAK